MLHVGDFSDKNLMGLSQFLCGICVVVPGNPDPEEAEVKFAPLPSGLACFSSCLHSAGCSHASLYPPSLPFWTSTWQRQLLETHAHPLTVFALKDVSCEVIFIFFHRELRIWSHFVCHIPALVLLICGVRLYTGAICQCSLWQMLAGTRKYLKVSHKYPSSHF